MQSCRTAWAILAGLLVGGTAAAQSPAPAVEHRRPSLNVGVGVVASSVEGVPDSATLLSIGTDLPITARWSIRLEAGRRVPARWTSTNETTYGMPDPAAPAEAPRSIHVQAIERVAEHSRVDLALLLRGATSHRRRFEAAALIGLDLNIATWQYRLTIPQDPNDPSNVSVSEHVSTRVRGVLDIGAEAGVHVTDRTTLLVYGLIGLQSPYEENRTARPRAGVIFKRRF